MTKRVKRVAASVAKSGFETAGREALSLARTAWLAGLGAVASAGEAGVAAFETLVEKGRRRSEGPMEKVERTLAEGGREAARLVENAGRTVYRNAAALLDQLELPTQAEIRALRARIETLRTRLS
jgi:polyhydroxyalkanoate synthesis regulator phasin